MATDQIELTILRRAARNSGKVAVGHYEVVDGIGRTHKISMTVDEAEADNLVGYIIRAEPTKYYWHPVDGWVNLGDITGSTALSECIIPEWRDDNNAAASTVDQLVDADTAIKAAPFNATDISN